MIRVRIRPVGEQEFNNVRVTTGRGLLKWRDEVVRKILRIAELLGSINLDPVDRRASLEEVPDDDDVSFLGRIDERHIVDGAIRSCGVYTPQKCRYEENRDYAQSCA